MPAGCGPRHCAFGNGKLYVSTELSDEVLVLDWPSMQLRQRCLVNDARPGGGGHLLLSPDGTFLYASSRLKNDGIALFRMEKDGLLKRCGYAELYARDKRDAIILYGILHGQDLHQINDALFDQGADTLI